MAKREIKKNFYEAINDGFEMLRMYEKEHNDVMYEYKHTQILAQLELASRLEIITFGEFKKLFDRL